MVRGRAFALVGVLIAGGAITACEPPPPRPAFVVNSFVAADDVTPGDGVCESAPGNGLCSLRAAVQEGNALGAADIELPAGTHQETYGAGYVVTANLAITGPGPDVAIELRNRFTVAQGGVLALSELSSTGGGYPSIRVEGVFLGRDLHLAVLESPTLDVRASGTAIVHNSILVGALLPPVVNAGIVHVRHSYLLGDDVPPPFPSGAGAIETKATGTSTISSSILTAVEFQTCIGKAPISGGYNISNGPGASVTCPANGSSDVSGLPLDIARLGEGSPSPWAYTIGAASPLVDAIPVGTNGCGEAVTDDLFGSVRPVEGNGNAASGCDIGPIERPTA